MAVKTGKCACKKSCKATKETPAKAVKTAKKSASKKVNVAFIGYGIQARTVLVPNFIKQATVVVKAVCDCDKVRREAGLNRNHKLL